MQQLATPLLESDYDQSKQQLLAKIQNIRNQINQLNSLVLEYDSQAAQTGLAFSAKQMQDKKQVREKINDKITGVGKLLRECRDRMPSISSGADTIATASEQQMRQRDLNELNTLLAD